MNGVLNINKPVGITSFDVVRMIKKYAKTGKVGHTGTLDPEASGVLPVCIGSATKIVDYIMSGSKVYKTDLKLGIVTDTYDKEGTVLSENIVDVNEDQINNVINKFVGKISQIPPMYSAIKVNGKKLYDLARQGITIEREPRDITIYYIKINKIQIPFVSMEICCSKGTYIRSLCHDIGFELGCGGAMWSLVREESGIFTLEHAISLEMLNENNIEEYAISIEEALGAYESVHVDAKFKKEILNGMSININLLRQDMKENELYKVYLDGMGFIGLGVRHGGYFKIKKQLFK